MIEAMPLIVIVLLVLARIPSYRRECIERKQCDKDFARIVNLWNSNIANLNNKR